MEAKNSEKIEESLEKVMYFIINLLLAFINVFITVFVVFGAVASLTLLYKMFPETALILLKPMFTIFHLMSNIFYVTAVMLFAVFCAYFVVRLSGVIQIKKKEREEKRKEFMEDLVKKLKKELKN